MLAVMNYDLATLGRPTSVLPQQQPHYQIASLRAFLPTERVVENLTPPSRPLPDKQPKQENGSMFVELRKQFELRDESGVRTYLRKYPFLLTLLLEAKTQVVRIFGEGTKAVLQISVDPNDLSAQLFIVIPTQLSAKEALALFDQLDQEWWLEATKRADFRMNFIPEFV